MSTERPFGVVILAILEALGGLAELGIGALALLAAGILGSLGEIPEAGGLAGIIASVMIFIGAILVILGLIALLIAYGLYTGKSWAWTLALIFAIIGIVLGILTLPGGIINLLINILILYYLTRPHVKAFFGKGPSAEAPPPPPA